MPNMKFKFTIQNYQTEAVNSVVKVFTGQPFQDNLSYRRDTGAQVIKRDLFNFNLSDEELSLGFENQPVVLDPKQLLKNIQEIQKDNNIKESSSLFKLFKNKDV